MPEDKQLHESMIVIGYGLIRPHTSEEDHLSDRV